VVAAADTRYSQALRRRKIEGGGDGGAAVSGSGGDERGEVAVGIPWHGHAQAILASKRNHYTPHLVQAVVLQKQPRARGLIGIPIPIPILMAVGLATAVLLAVAAIVACEAEMAKQAQAHKPATVADAAVKQHPLRRSVPAAAVDHSTKRTAAAVADTCAEDNRTLHGAEDDVAYADAEARARNDDDDAHMDRTPGMLAVADRPTPEPGWS
jgi:hypothetical protein